MVGRKVRDAALQLIRWRRNTCTTDVAAPAAPRSPRSACSTTHCMLAGTPCLVLSLTALLSTGLASGDMSGRLSLESLLGDGDRRRRRLRFPISEWNLLSPQLRRIMLRRTGGQHLLMGDQHDAVCEACAFVARWVRVPKATYCAGVQA